MRAWLITVGEPLTIDPGNARLLRTGILAGQLADAGWDVVFWTSTFNHTAKTHRFDTDTVVDLRPNLRLRLLHGRAYRRNVSLARIANHGEVARKFRKYAAEEVPPDVILCSLPTVELSLEANAYGRARGIPVVLDARDRWPDIFVDLAPRPLRPLARLALQPMFSAVRRACREATAVIGHTESFVDWAVAYADRPRRELDRAFAFGYSSQEPAPAAMAEAEKFWDDHGVTRDDPRFVLAFFGTLGRQFDLETVIRAARELDRGERRMLFVICGEGDRAADYRRTAAGLDNVLFAGWVDAPRIWVLMRRAAAGLAPYMPSDDFAMSLPNKLIEYLSAGLPVISSLPGLAQSLLAECGCGVTYPAGDAAGLSAALIRLYDDRRSLQDMSARAADLYRQRFVAETIYGEMTRYLQDLARASGAQPGPQSDQEEHP